MVGPVGMLKLCFVGLSISRLLTMRVSGIKGVAC